MVKAMQDSYERVTGMNGTPVTTTGGTYARPCPVSIPFGPSFPGQKGISHNPNEWMTVDEPGNQRKNICTGSVPSWHSFRLFAGTVPADRKKERFLYVGDMLRQLL